MPEETIDTTKEKATTTEAAPAEEAATTAEAETSGMKAGKGLRFIKSKGVCRKCRRAGEKLFLKGEKCLSPKCPITRRTYAPGMHGSLRTGRPSEYQRQLREKQKLAQIYILSARELKNYFGKASREKGATASKLFEFLERRLDNAVFRLGLTPSRKSARELIRRKMVLVNQRAVTIAGYSLNKNDVIEFSKATALPKGVAKIPAWLEQTKDGGAKVMGSPSGENEDISVDANLIVEFYSK